MVMDRVGPVTSYRGPAPPFVWRDWENHSTSVMTASLQAENRTRDFLLSAPIRSPAIVNLMLSIIY
jgi:hypothetical protein